MGAAVGHGGRIGRCCECLNGKAGTVNSEPNIGPAHSQIFGSPLPMTTSSREHPTVLAPKLFISGLAPDVTEADIARALETCIPIRPKLLYDSDSNTKYGELSTRLVCCKVVLAV